VGKGGGFTPDTISQGMTADSNALVKLATQQGDNANKLFNLAEPGLATTENYYETLASGDPGAIMRAIAPTAQQSTEAATGAKSNIMANAPAGGEKNLALEMTDVNRAAQISKTASGATTGAPNALGQLAAQGVGESISSAGTGISGLSASSSTLSSLGNYEIEQQKLQMEQKGQALGAFGSLAGDAAGLAFGI
jgi:hypothetical protein